MKNEAIQHVAAFLEACPTQVTAWDNHVIEHLTKNPHTLQAFKTGCETTKWGIYHAIKYRFVSPRPA